MKINKWIIISKIFIITTVIFALSTVYLSIGYEFRILELKSKLSDYEKPQTCIELSSGNYVAGEDFPAGIYDISVIEGSGNVFSYSEYDGGFNVMMGDKWTMEYKDAKLHDGVTLTIRQLTVKMIQK